MFAKEAGKRFAQFANTVFLLWFAPVGIINGFDICREINDYVGFDTRLCCDPDCDNVTDTFYQCKYCIDDAYCDECFGIHLQCCSHCGEYFCYGTHSPVSCADCGDTFCLDCKDDVMIQCEICHDYYCDITDKINFLDCHEGYVCDKCLNQKKESQDIIQCDCCEDLFCCQRDFYQDGDEMYCENCYEPPDPDLHLPNHCPWIPQ